MIALDQNKRHRYISRFRTISINKLTTVYLYQPILAPHIWWSEHRLNITTDICTIAPENSRVEGPGGILEVSRAVLGRSWGDFLSSPISDRFFDRF